MKDNRKTIKISDIVHRKMKIHVANIGKNVSEFTEWAIEQQIKTDKLTARIIKSSKK